MSFKFKALNYHYMELIQSFTDKKKYYKSMIWARFMKRVKTFGFQIRNKRKWRVVSYCQPLNGYRVDFLTYHTIDAIFRAKVERKKAEKEKKAAAKKNKQKTKDVVVTPTQPKSKEYLTRYGYIKKEEVLNFKVLSTFLKKHNEVGTLSEEYNSDNLKIPVEGNIDEVDVESDDDSDKPLTLNQQYNEIIKKSKTINKKLVRKQKAYSSKYSHLVTQFFFSKQRDEEGREIEKIKTFKTLDPRVQLLIRARAKLFKAYMTKRQEKFIRNTRMYLVKKKKFRGFDFAKFQNVTRTGLIIQGTKKKANQVKKDLKKKLF